MEKIKLDKHTREMMIQRSISDYEDSYDAIESVLRRGFTGLENKSDTGLFYDEIQSMGYETVEDFEERYEYGIKELREEDL